MDISMAQLHSRPNQSLCIQRLEGCSWDWLPQHLPSLHCYLPSKDHRGSTSFTMELANVVLVWFPVSIAWLLVQILCMKYFCFLRHQLRRHWTLALLHYPLKSFTQISLRFYASGEIRAHISRIVHGCTFRWSLIYRPSLRQIFFTELIG